MDSLASRQPETTAFEARIERRAGPELVLDRTYFYPESGGQPADRGTIDGTTVLDVQKRDGEVIHTLADETDLESGESVSCEIDSAFRTYCMRTHTASHVLYGAGRLLLEDLGYGGFDIDRRKARIDFETSTEIDDALLVELETLANRAVWESRPVSWETVPVEEARSCEEVAFNTKTEEGVFGDGEGIRIVTIEAAGNTGSDRGSAERRSGDSMATWDAAACGGTHVSNTHEIGPISVLGRSNPGEGLTRVEIAVGPTAIDHRAETRVAALSAARGLEVGVVDLPDAIERQRTAVEELEEERDELLNRIAAFQIDALRDEIVGRADERWLVGSVAGVDGDVLSNRARELAGEDCEVAALTTDERPVTIAIASASETDAGAVIDSLTTEFGGGGGGGPEFAQGGGIDADPETVVASLRSR